MDGLYSSAAALGTQEQLQETIAFNVANVNTPAFKRRVHGLELPYPSFDQVFNESAGDDSALPQISSKVDFTQGDLRPTENPFDLGIDGKGFFKVRVDNNANRYTRKGNFIIDSSGQLVTQDGHPVLYKDGGAPFTLNGGPMIVDREGNVFQGSNRLGKLDIVSFEDESQLVAENGGLFTKPDEVTEQPSVATVHQGRLESSNVNPIEEMVALIVVNRHFEAAQRLMHSFDEIMRKSLER